MEAWAKLIEAIAGLVGAVAWPVAIVVAVWLIMRRHRDAFGRLIDRVSSFQFPGGQVDLAAVEAAQKEQVQALADQVAKPDLEVSERQNAVDGLVDAASDLGRIQARQDSVAMSVGEIKLLDLMAQGRNIPEIADELKLARSTVSRQTRQLMQRVGAMSRYDLVEWWLSRRFR